jgi:hypothetical protein
MIIRTHHVLLADFGGDIVWLNRSASADSET